MCFIIALTSSIDIMKIVHLNVPVRINAVTRAHRLIGLSTLRRMRYIEGCHIGRFEQRDDMHKMK